MRTINHSFYTLCMVLVLWLCPFGQILANRTSVPSIEQTDSLLFGIEETIMNTFIQSRAQQSDVPLTTLGDQLEQAYQQTKQGLFQYWQAYTLFYTAVYHAQINQKKAAGKWTDRAITLLRNTPQKTSEDYALLAFLQGFSISFKNSLQAPLISTRSSRNARKAVEMDPNNPRGYYVLGNNDYYTPSQFGGGKQVVEYMEKTIALSENQHPTPYLPAWGTENAYEILLLYHHREEKADALQATINRIRKDFPGSYRLNAIIKKVSS